MHHPPERADGERPQQGRAFGAFRHRDFRLYWGGSFSGHVGNWMAQVAQAWLIYDLTRSPFLVGLTGLFLSVPFVLMSLYAGSVVDRVDRKRLLIWSQVGDLINTLVLAALILSGNVQVWQIYVNAIFSALIGSFQNPSQQALLPYLVPRADLMTAISLNSILRRGTQIIGPSLGGICVATMGVGNTYLVRALTYFVLIACLMAVSVTNPVEDREQRANPLRSILEGLRYVRAEKVIGGLLLLESLISIFGSYNTMLVVFARDIFEAGPQGLGVLQSAAGAGTIIGSLVLAGRGNITHVGRVMLSGAVVYSLAVISLAYAPWFLVALPALLIAGTAEVTVGALRATTLQLESRRDVLGRVMSLHAISTRGLGPLGGFEAGTLAELIGVRSAIALGATVCLTSVIVVAFRIPAIARFQVHAHEAAPSRPLRRDGAELVPNGRGDDALGAVPSQHGGV